VNHAAQSDTEDEEYQVYSTVIRSLPIDLPRGLLMIKDQTDLLDRVRLIESQQIPREVLDELYTKNQKTVKLKERFLIPYRYHLLNRDEDDGYGYPLIGLSRVAFNHSMDLSLIYVTFTKGAASNKEWYVLLTKSSGQWSVQRTLVVMKSPGG